MRGLDRLKRWEREVFVMSCRIGVPSGRVCFLGLFGGADIRGSVWIIENNRHKNLPTFSNSPLAFHANQTREFKSFVRN